MDFVERVLAWNRAAGNTEGEFNPRQAALYVGLILEEVAEMLEEFRGDIYVRQLAERFKRGEFDEAMAEADRIHLADAGCDIAVVAVGLLMSLGADVQGALREVCDSNDSKLVDGRLLKDGNGKVIKPAGYRQPNLEEFLS